MRARSRASEPLADVKLRRGEVHVWRISLRAPPRRVAALRELLSDEERRRADRLFFVCDRDRFVIARAQLRRILAAYLRTSPRALTFETTRHGKPFLPLASTLRFNLSHAHELALLAVTREGEIGVDLEWKGIDVSIERMARRVFSPDERAELARLPAAKRVDGFFRLWTRKESYVKAKGGGLTIPLESFSVALGPGPAVPWQSHADPEETKRWMITALPIDRGYAAALTTAASATAKSRRRTVPSLRRLPA